MVWYLVTIILPKE